MSENIMLGSTGIETQHRIFVTGVPRSGTTFVGKVLSLPLGVDYLNEPFNLGDHMPEGGRRYRYVRHDGADEEKASYDEAVRRILRYDVNLRTPLHPRNSWHRKLVKRVVGGRGAVYLWWARLNPFTRTVVIKDPTAGLLSEYLYRDFDITPVIVVKHPVSLVASLKRVGWHPSLHWFREQEHLVEDFFADERAWLEQDRSTVVEAGAAHWRAVYKVLLTWAQRYPGWRVVVLEALSQRPVAMFRQLYEELDVPWSRAVERKVRALTQGTTATARGDRVQDMRRNSAEIFSTYRNAMSLEERRTIFEIVQDVALQVYSVESFALDGQSHQAESSTIVSIS